MEKHNWFSWGWLIFWIIVNPVVAIIYLIIKYEENHKKSEWKILRKIIIWILIIWSVICLTVVMAGHGFFS